MEKERIKKANAIESAKKEGVLKTKEKRKNELIEKEKLKGKK